MPGNDREVGVELMTMPLPSRLIYTLVSLLMPLGAHLADYNVTHIFNPRWPPHAKFHTGQTLMMSVLLGVLTIFFAWRKSADRLGAVLAASGFASLYWITQALAIVYPGTAAVDPEFKTPGSYPHGIASQYYIDAAFLALIALAAWIALRKGGSQHIRS
ncbi:MAG TPA: DUF6640 family protein [Steroidobacteraceae bacterium]